LFASAKNLPAFLSLVALLLYISLTAFPMKARAEPPIDWTGVGLVFLTPALGGLLYGYDIGAMSFVLDMLTPSDSVSGVHSHHGTVTTRPHFWWDDFASRRVAQGLTMGAVSAGALLGSHIVLFYLASHVGRRTELRVAALLYMIGSLLCYTSGTMLAQQDYWGWYSLVLGRLVIGTGVGFVMHGAPTYMAEMAPSSIRGAVVSAKETVIVLGIVLGYLVGDMVGSRNNNGSGDWTLVYWVSLAIGTPMLVLTFVIPRSKRWLLLHGHKEEARVSMQFVYKGNINTEFEELAASIQANRMYKQHSTAVDQGGLCGLLESRLFSKPIRPALQAAMGLIILQQLSGQPSLLSYATVLFHAAGWGGHASVITAMLMLCVSITTVLLVDRLGRKRLLLTSITVLGMAAFTLSHVFWNWKNGAVHELQSLEKTVVLIAMFVYIGAYQIGFGPITWCFVSEVFPMDVRGPATALAVELNYAGNFVVQFFVPLVQNKIGWGPTFLVFGCSMLTGFYFVWKKIPETAGLSLEEIEARLHRDHDDEVAAQQPEQDVCTVLDSVSDTESNEGSPLIGGKRHLHDYTTAELSV
jgi:sugar porter (SP) family MFS transporter